MEPRQDDLESTFRDIAAALPRLTTYDDEFVLSRDNLPVPPRELSTEALWFRRRGWHVYNNFPVPRIDLCIDKPGCRLLGLLILAVVFHPEPETVDLHLRHHGAQVDLLRVRHEPESWNSYYRTIPESFSYWPGTSDRHPWAQARVDQVALPLIEVTTRDELGPINAPDWMGHCDTVIGFGHDLAAVGMAQLLLNASLDDAQHVEYDLARRRGRWISKHRYRQC